MQAIQPTRLEIFITNRCNLRCTYCSSKHITAKTAKTLSFRDLTKAVDLFAGYGGRSSKTRRDSSMGRTICFTGGEPLLEFDLLKRIIKYIRGQREWFAITVNTNGTLLTREMADFLLVHDIYLAVSLDGAKPVHDLHRIFKDDRRASVYDALTKNLRALPPQYLKNVRASVTITARTMPSIINTVGLLQDMGFRFVELGLDAYEIWTGKKLNILEKTLSSVRNHYIALLNSNSFEKMRRVFNFSFENKQVKAGFYAPMNEVSLSPDGLFYPSDTLATASAGNQEFVVGDLENGIDFAKLKGIYSRAAVRIPPDKRAEGAFSPVDRYLYCRIHGRKPGEMLADAAGANRIFLDKIGGLLEIQRIYRELAKNSEFGDLIHRPKYFSAGEIKNLNLRISKISKIRLAIDYALYSGAGNNNLAVCGNNSSAVFDTIEAAGLYSMLKSRLLGKRIKFTVESDSL